MVASQTDNTSLQAQGSDPLGELAQFATDATSSPATALGSSILAEAIMAYDNATQNGGSSEEGIAAVEKLGASIVPELEYKTYAASDVRTDPDTSKDRVLSYRADLRVALEPLLQNKELELDIFASYVETKDKKYLSALRNTSDNYRQAITNTEKVVAPADAASYQASILTSMSQFSSMLDALADHADDPFASAALLKSYMIAQDSMIASFNSIGMYASQKLL